MDISTLAVVVKSDGIDDATDKLNKLVTAATQADGATAKLASNTSKASADVGNSMNEGVSKGADATISTLTKFQQRVIEMQDTWLNNQRAADDKAYQDKISLYTRLFAQRDAQTDAASQKAIAQAQSEANAMNSAFDKMARDRLAAEQTMYRSIAQQEAQAAADHKAYLDKQLQLDVNYEKASIASKIRLAQEAQIWQSKGVDATSKVGAQAAAADIGQLSAALKQQKIDIDNAKHSTDGFSLSTSAAKREVLVLAHELSQGQYKRFGGSFLVLLEQTNMAGVAIAAATSGWTYFGLAIVAAAYEALQGALAFKDMKQALTDSGNSVGLTAEGLWNMSTVLGGVTNNVHGAQEAFTGLVNTGKFTTATLYQAGETALAISKNTGQAMGEIVQELSKITDNALKYADDYQTAHHTMSASDRERIKSLQEAGESERAVLEVLKLIEAQSSKTAIEAEQNIGILKMAYLGWKGAINDVLTALDNLGKKSVDGNLSDKSIQAGIRVDQALALRNKAKESGDVAEIARAQQILDFNTKQLNIINAQIIAKQKDAEADQQRGLTGDVAKQIGDYKTGHITEMSKSDRANALITRENEMFNTMKTNAEKALGNISLTDMLVGNKTIDTSKLSKDQQIVYTQIQEAYGIHLRTLETIKERAEDKSNQKGIDDRYRAQLSVIDGQIQDAKATLKQTELDNDSAFARGEIGKFELLQKNLEAEKQYYADEIALRQKAYNVARPEDRTAKGQDLANATQQAKSKAIESEMKIDLEYDKFSSDLRAKAVADEVKSLQQKGEYVKAFNLQWEEDGAHSTSVLQKEVSNAQDQFAKAFAADDSGNMDKWSERLTTLTKALEAAKLQYQSGLNKATGEELGNQADSAYKTLKVMVENVYRDMDNKNIFDVIVGDQATVDDIINNRIPEVQKKLQDWKTLAFSDKGTPAMQAAVSTLESAIGKIVDKGVKIPVTVDIKSLTQISTFFSDMAAASKDMGDGWKKATDALSGFSSAFKDLAAARTQDEKQADSGTATRIGAYGQMASAAKNFFGESSAGYKTLDGLAKVAHVAQMGMLIAENGMLAVRAVLAALGTPVIGFAAGAAMAVAVGALGYAVGGGFSSGVDTSHDAANVQKLQGTGTILGDANAKSDSLSKSLDLLSKTSDKLYNVNTEMLSNLKSINQGISGLANIVARNLGITTGSNMNIQEGTLSKTTDASSLLGIAGGAGAAAYLTPFLGTFFGALGLGVGALLGSAGGWLVGKIASLWGKTTQTITDSGLQFSGTLGDLEKGQGYSQYANVQTTSSSWFGLSKSTTNSQVTQAADQSVSDAFAQIFTSMSNSLKTAAKQLYGSSDEVSKALDSMVLSTTQVSLKGLSGQALQDAINNVLSKSFDDMATAAFPSLVKFQQSGEGMGQTVVRLATEVGTVNAVMNAMGAQTLALGDAGIGAADALVQAAGSLDTFTSQAEYFVQNFLSESDQINVAAGSVNTQMSAMGLGFIHTNAQFAAYVKSLDLSTDAGQKQYTALMALAPAFDTVTKYITKITDSITSAQTGLNSDIQKILASQDGYDAIADAQTQVTAAQQAYLAATNPADQITALGTLRTAITNRYNAEIAMIQKVKSEMDAITSFQTDIAASKQTVLSASPDYDAVAYSISQVTAAQQALDAATNPEDQLAAGKVLQTAIMNRYNAEVAAINKASQAQQDAINTAGAAAVEAQNNLNAAYRSIGDYATSLLTSTSSPLSGRAQMTFMQDAFSTLVMQLKSGDITNASNYQTTANSLLQAGMNTAKTAQDYARTFYGILGNSQDLGNLAQADQTWQDVTITNQDALNQVQTKALQQLDDLNKLTEKWQSDLQKKLDDYAGKTATWQDATLIAQNKAIGELQAINAALASLQLKVNSTIGDTTTNDINSGKTSPYTPIGSSHIMSTGNVVSSTTSDGDEVMVGNPTQPKVVSTTQSYSGNAVSSPTTTTSGSSSTFSTSSKSVQSTPLLDWSAPTNTSTSDNTSAVYAVADNVAQLQSDVKVALTQVAINTNATAKWLQRWNGDGMPETRTWVDDPTGTTTTSTTNPFWVTN